MDPAKVALLVAASGLYELSPKARKLIQSEEFWDELEATPEDALTKEQRDALAEMGVNLGEDGDDGADENEDDGAQ